MNPTDDVGMRFEVLGPVRVGRGDEMVGVPGRLRRNLLAMLLAHANERVPVDALLSALWGEDSDPQRVQRLHLHIHKLRATLSGSSRITHGPGGYSLTVRDGELDAVEFDRLFEEGSSASADDPERSASLLSRALSLFHGSPYHDVDVVDLAGEVQRYTERRRTALEEYFAAEIRCGRHTAVIAGLSEAARAHPLRERLHGLLMTALARGGRQAEALEAYRHAHTMLGEELGLDPGPELRELEQLVLAGEPVRWGGEPELSAFAEQHTPAQLPPAPTGFIGREHEFSQLDALLDSQCDSVVLGSVTGPGGVGKTAAVLRWAHRVRLRFPDGQLYADLRGFGPEEPERPEEVVASLLRSLGVEETGIPRDREGRSALLRSLLAGTRTLLVLDNAASAEQARPLLPGTAGCAVVVTSRDPLVGLSVREGAARIALGHLSTEDARCLVREQLGPHRVDHEADAVDLLIERCAALPLALRIAIERIRLRGASSIGELIDELETSAHRLEVLDDNDPYSSVRSLFSWSYRNLSPTAAELFRRTSLHPGSAIDETALAALADQDLHSTRRSLEQLLRAHLIQRSDEGRYSMHDLLHAYAQELTREVDGAEPARAVTARLFDHYVSTAAQAMEWITPRETDLRSDPNRTPTTGSPEFSSYWEARSWLDSERRNLLQIADCAPARGLPGHTTDLVALLWPYLDLGCFHDSSLHLHSRGLEIAREQNDAVGTSVALRGLGLHHLRQDRLEQARAHLEDSLSSLPTDDDHGARAMTLNYLAAVYSVLDRPDEALGLFQKSLAAFARTDNRRSPAKALNNLGIAYTRSGRHEDARECLHQALALAAAHGHHGNTAYALTNLARLQREAGRDEAALQYADRARVLAARYSLPGVGGVVREILGTVNRRLGNTEAAVTDLHRVLEFAQENGDRTLIIRAHNGLGEAYTTTADTAEANHHFAQALAASAGGTGRNARRGTARAQRGLGLLNTE